MYAGDEHYGDEITSPQAGDVRRPRSATQVLTDAKRERFGFLNEAELALVAGDPHLRLTPMLVRCNGCRFICGAQDVRHLIACVQAGGDYVRDVSVYVPQP